METDTNSTQDLSLSTMTTDSVPKNLYNIVRERLVTVSPTVKAGLERECTKEDFNLEVDNCIGKGSFGEVYKVMMHSTGKTYAIKVLDKTYLIENKQVNLINREIELMYKLNHPHIIKLINHFEDDNKIYLIMPFMQKGQLYKHLKAQSRFDERTASQYILETIEAVSYLHSFQPKIVHRDIKPENLLLDHNFRIQLSDFGIADYLDITTNCLNSICGSAEYMAPEIIKGLTYDHSVDVWAIGVLIFELIAGYPPFRGANNAELTHNIKKVKINWPGDFPPLAKNLISKILKLEPSERISLEEIKRHAWFLQKCPLRPSLPISTLNDKDVLSTHLMHSTLDSICDEIYELFNPAINKVSSFKDRTEKKIIIDDIVLPSSVSSRHNVSQFKGEEVKSLKLKIGQLEDEIHELKKSNEELEVYQDTNFNLQEEIKTLQLSNDEKSMMIVELEEKITLLEKENIIIKNNQINCDLTINKLSSLNKMHLREIESLRKELDEIISTSTCLLREKEEHQCIKFNCQQDDQPVFNQVTLFNSLRELKTDINNQMNNFTCLLNQIKHNQKTSLDKLNDTLVASISTFNNLLRQLNDSFCTQLRECNEQIVSSQLQAKDKQIQWLKEQNDSLLQYKNEHVDKENKSLSLESQLVLLNDKYKTLISSLSSKEVLFKLTKEKEINSTKKYMELKYHMQNVKDYALQHFSQQKNKGFFDMLN